MSTYGPFNHPGGTNHLLNGTEIFNRLIVDGNYIDGSWELSIYVEDLGSTIQVRVLGDLTLGGLMHRIVENVKIQQSWSDHAIWWSDRNMWLLQNRTTLDQYGIQSDAKLMFRRMHNDLQIVLPSLTTITLRVNYASRVFSVVRNICKELNIRHSEELSLTFPITKNMLKANCPLPTIRHGIKRPCVPTNSRAEPVTNRAKMPTPPPSLGIDGQVSNPYPTLASNSGTITRFKSDNSLDQERLDFGRYADCSLRRSAKAVFADNWLMRPKNLIQKARLNSGWLDSSRSLLEQGVEPVTARPTEQESPTPPTLYLCFKYFAFYDLVLKYDSVRIHQLYEQARWSILSGILDCTEDEMVVFAAYQLQAELQSTLANQSTFTGLPDAYGSNPYSTIGGFSTVGMSRGTLKTSSPDTTHKPYHSPLFPSSGYYGGSLTRFPKVVAPTSGGNTFDLTSSQITGGFDEVDELLSELEQSCGVAEEPGSATRSLQNSTLIRGGTMRSNLRGFDITDTSEIPSLEGKIKVFRDRTLLLKRYKVYWVVIKEARLYLFRNETNAGEPLAEYSLRDSTVTPDVSTANQKYVIKLSVLNEPNRKISNGSFTNVNNVSAQRVREEIWLRFDSAEQYSRWLAACRLGSRGKTLASRVAYEKEVGATLELLNLQTPGPAPAITASESIKYLGDLTDFCAERIIRRARSKDALRLRITEAHVNIRDLSLLEAKFKYIQAWQRLNGFGRSYFIVEFERGQFTQTNSGIFSAQMDDLIAICPGRIEVISPQTGEVTRAWNFSDLRSWNVNWDAGRVILEFRNNQLSFQPLSTNCKTIVEFIGGYVFLSQRNPEKSQDLNERLFYRLTAVSD